MPIYEYHCHACGKTIELLQKINEEPAKHCTECGAETLEKIVSASKFQLKGTGWYVTDFRDKDKKNKEKPQNERGGDAPTGTDAKTKPENSDS